ncbi:MAG TPA: ThuA domain-containing protein [Porticoccus sp.]|nr:ThuA domain-containing protein [Porticoccus sp.]
MKRVFKYLGLALLIYLAYAGIQAYRVLDQAEVFKEAVYETEAPTLAEDFPDNAVLVFSKTNEFRHHQAIAAANQLFRDIAQKHNLPIYFTENGAIHNTEQLKKFSTIIWNNNTGDVLTPEQRQALADYIKQGGHWLGIHGAGGSRDYDWQWYPQQLLKATFIGHPLFPQFQQATIDVEDRTHPATQHLPARWQRTEEWYSFEQSPRVKGVQVLASLDESTYNPKLDLLMDDDHPLIWTHKLGQGIVFYTALGHNGSAYQEPEYQQLLENTLLWLMNE